MSLAAPACLRRAVLIAVLATVLAGCGQTGPLYLPEGAADDGGASGPGDETEEESTEDERRSP